MKILNAITCNLNGIGIESKVNWIQIQLKISGMQINA
jgi:hypothetical protein